MEEGIQNEGDRKRRNEHLEGVDGREERWKEREQRK